MASYRGVNLRARHQTKTRSYSLLVSPRPATYDTIRLTLGDQSVPCYSSDYQPCSSVPLLHTFTTTSVSDTCQLIIKSTSTTCALDPIPTWLLKHIAEDLAPFLSTVIEDSPAWCDCWGVVDRPGYSGQGLGCSL